MSTQLKLRRGTTAQHSTFRGASGEVTVDTTKKTLVVHDGTTAGGVPLLPATTGGVATANLADGAVTTAKIADSNVTDAKIAAMAASKLTGDVAAARITNALNATGSAPIYACRAWVNFNGTGTVAIRGSGNVSSITDLTTGQYRVNFTTALPDANFSATVGSQNTLTNANTANNIYNFTASSVEFAHVENGSSYDTLINCVAIFR